jgi:hypothetical protein
MKPRASTAVMASRLPGRGLQLFPTPPYATRSPIEQELLPRGWITSDMSVWDPCCGRGHMAVPLGDYFDRVWASDVHDWGFGNRRDLDFTSASAGDAPWPVDWVFANPPFTLAETFLARSLDIARRGVALFVRLQWMEGVGRYENIWSGEGRPHIVCPFAERVSCVEGAWDPDVSGATAYMWAIWAKGVPRPEWPICHIRPGAKANHSRSTDHALATPGEAGRRKATRQPQSMGIVSGLPLFPEP